MGYDTSDKDIEDLFKILRLRENDLNKIQSQIHNLMNCINCLKLVESREEKLIDEKQVSQTVFLQPKGFSGNEIDEKTRIKDKKDLIININKFLTDND